MGGLHSSGSVVSLIRDNGLSCVICANGDSGGDVTSCVGLFGHTGRLNVTALASLSATGTLTSVVTDQCGRVGARLISVGGVQDRGDVLGFDGVRNADSSCVFFGGGYNVVAYPRDLTVRFASERGDVNNSKVILVRSSGVTGTGVHVFGLSNSRNGVTNGSVHYINGCLCSGNFISGSEVAIRATDKVGILSLFAQGNGISSIAMGVNGTCLGPGRVPILLSNSVVGSQGIGVNNDGCGVAYISVKGPRYVIFISGISGVSVRGANPRFRGTPVFPRQMGARFIEVMGRRAVGVHI